MVRFRRKCLGVVIAVILTSSLAPDASAVYRQYVVKGSFPGPEVPIVALQIVAAIVVIGAFFYGTRY